MMRFRHVACKGWMKPGVIGAFVISMLLPASGAYAQAGGDPPMTSLEQTGAPSLNIHRSLLTLDYGPGVVSTRQAWSASQAASGGRQRSIGRKVAGAAIGVVGGFFGGLFLGAAIEGYSCECDDPGLEGAAIGAPIGSVIGGIVGFKFF